MKETDVSFNRPAANHSRTIEAFAALANSAPANTLLDEVSGASGYLSSTVSVVTPMTIATAITMTPSGTSTSSVEYACLGVAVGFGSRISGHILGFRAVTAVLTIRQFLVVFQVFSRLNIYIFYI